MTQEEKAKAYDVALERAKAFNERWQCIQTIDSELALKELKEIFSELKESEDERIRKMLIDSFTRADMGGEIYGKGVTYKQVIAWLEKQGGKKPDDKVEPKFKVGDWVFIEEIKGYKQGAFQIKSVDEFGYNFDECDTIPFKYEEFLSKWAISDARDGDVLAEDTCTFIIKKLNRDLSAEIYCCLYDDGDFETNTKLVFDDTSTYPATKEQRDLLFQKMKEVGYEWDAEKKELKVIADEEQLNPLREEYKITQEDKNMIIEELLRQKRRFELEKSTLTHNSDNYHELRGRIWAYNDAIAFINSI